MKNNLIILFVLLCISPVMHADKKNKRKKKTSIDQTAPIEGMVNGEYIKPLDRMGALFPEFSVVDDKQHMILSNTLDKNSPKAIVLFNPGCGHCKIVATTLKDNIDKFKNATFVFMCGLPLLEYVPTFAKETGTDTVKQFIISADNSNITKDLFEYKGIPQIMIYNKEQKLQKIFYQEINVDSVVYYLNK